MGLPSKENIELPLLKVIQDAGGELRVGEAIERVSEYFPDLPAAEVIQRVPSGEGKWSNRIRWSRLVLASKGELERDTAGIWKISDKGSIRVAKEWSSWGPKYAKARGASAHEATASNPVNSGGSILAQQLVSKVSAKEDAKRWKLFEADILRFLEKLGFQDTRGGQETRIVFGQQIDACGGFGDTLFLVEAKYSTRKSSRSLETAINDIVVNRPKIVRMAKKDALYSKYRRFAFVISTRNIEVGEADQRRMRERDVYWWDAEHLIAYYSKLFTYIGKYAVFNLLGELGVKPPEDRTVRLPAMREKVGIYTLYTLFMNPHDLLEFAYVARRERGREEFYQRIISKERVSSIAKEYLDDQKGIFPNNIIVSIDEKTDFIPLKIEGDPFGNSKTQIGILQFPRTYSSARIIDGQHRLYAFTKTEQIVDVPVVAFDRLNISEQLKFFVDINQEQRPVNPNLIWDLNGQLRPEQLEGIVSNAVKRLNDLPPFVDHDSRCYRIYIPVDGEKKSGDLSISGLCNSILKAKLGTPKLRTRPEMQNPLYSADHTVCTRNLAQWLSLYFSTINDSFGENQRKFVFNTDGGASIMVFFCEKLLSRFGGKLDDKVLRKYTDELGVYLTSVNLDELRGSLTSEGMKDRVTDELVERIAVPLGDEELLSFIKNSKVNTRIDVVGQRLGDLLNRTMVQVSPNWLSENVDRVTLQKAKDHLERKIAEDPRTEVYQFFSLGELKVLLRKPDIWKVMKNTFVNVAGELAKTSKFNTEELLFGNFDLLIAYRNPPSHGTEIRIDKTNIGMIESTLTKLEKITGILS